MPPASIGPYNIERELGRGGMGEVFLATDTRLDRQVAIKALPAHLAQDAERLARFQREAKVLASLNHPNIAAIYGLEEAAGHQYLILEFVEGENLDTRLGNGPIPVEEAISIAKQIAEALEIAHDKGIVHRDVKPGNVMVTPEGVVKVLDFGLARTAESAPSSSHVPIATSSPTAHTPTVPGVILGTAGYMSPEQARGKAVDKRSDIFSFGCVFFEMLSGAAPFPGETVTDSLGAILHRDPDWNTLPAGIPPRVRDLLRSCLTKDRRNRLHDIGDARLELERAVASREWETTAAEHSSTPPAARVLIACAAGAAILAGGIFVGRALRTPTPLTAAPAYHVSAPIPAKPDLNWVAGIAPDSRFVIYKGLRAIENDSTKHPGILAIRRLDRSETRDIEGTEGALEGSLSEDGRWLAFVAARDRTNSRVQLKKLALDDGRPVGNAETLCDLPQSVGYTMCWSSDKELVISLAWEQRILAVSASGGEPRVISQESVGKGIDNWGEIRPLIPGKSILATRWAVVGQTVKERAEIIDLATGKRTPLLSNAGGTLLVDGRFLVARRNQTSIFAVRFDTSTMQTVGEPVTLLSGFPVGTFFLSANGTLAMTANSGDFSGRKLARIDQTGQLQPLTAPPRAYSNIAVAPDGNRIAFNLESADQGGLSTDLWIQDLSRKTFSRLSTTNPCFGFNWSRDGQFIAYNGVTETEFSIWVRRADGAGEPSKVYSSPNAQSLLYPADWSPDGKLLAVLQVDLAKGQAEVVMLSREPEGSKWTSRSYLPPSSGLDGFNFSPDGKWVRFLSEESGVRELFVQRFTGPDAGVDDAKGGRRQISSGGAVGGGWWSPDNKEIRYPDSEERMMSVQIQTEPSFTVSTPKMLYSLKDIKTKFQTSTPDGSLLVVLPDPSEQVSRIDLIVNFLDELRSKTAAK